MPISQFQLNEMQRRVATARSKRISISAISAEMNAQLDEEMARLGQVKRERDLHEQIIQHCRLNRYVCVHSRTDRPTTQGLGVADFIITMPGNRTIYVEAKTKTGKLRPEQQAFKCLVEHNGGKYFVVRSWEEFLKVVQ